MLPGWCCIANRHIGARERRQLIPHVRFQVPFLGPESQLKSSFFQIYMLVAKINAVVIFCLLQGSAFAVDFAIFAVSFLVPPDGPKKWDRGSARVGLSCACGPKNGTARRSHFWDRV